MVERLKKRLDKKEKKITQNLVIGNIIVIHKREHIEDAWDIFK